MKCSYFLSWPSWTRIVVVVLLLVLHLLQGRSRGEDIQGIKGRETTLGIQFGHHSGITDIVFSPDGRLVLTASYDGTARLWDVGSGRELRQFKGHTAGVSHVAFSPDGRLVLTASGDKTARLWETASGLELRQFIGHTDLVKVAAFSPDGRLVLTSSGDNTTRLWETASGRELQQWQLTAIIGHGHAAFSPDGRWVLTASGDNTARLWEAASGRELRQFTGHTAAVSHVAFSPDGRWVLTTASFDHTARLWEAASGRELQQFIGHIGLVNHAAFSPDGRWVLTASGDNTARLWEAASGRELRQFTGHTAAVSHVAFSPDGRWVLTASWDKTTRLWEAASGRELQQWHAGDSFTSNSLPGQHGYAVFSPDSRWVLTAANWEKTARLWEAASGRELQQFKGYTEAVKHVVFSPDGRVVMTANSERIARHWDVASGSVTSSRVSGCRESQFTGETDYLFSPDCRWKLTAGNDGTARLSEAASGRELRRFTGHTLAISHVAFSPDGRWVLTASQDKTARLWDAASGRELRQFIGHTDWIPHAGFSPDGRLVLTTSFDGTVRLWETTSGRELQQWHTGDKYGNYAVFSPDGRWVLIGGGDGNIRLWEAASGRQLRQFTGHTKSITKALFSPDGRWVLTASYDGTARLWEAVSGRQLQQFTGHTAAVSHVAFSPDGRWVLTASWDKTTRLWDAASGRELRQFIGHIGLVNHAAFSPDGRWVLTASGDNTARLWELASGKELVCLISFTDGTWAVVDPDGRFDAARAGDIEGLHWVVGLEPISLAQLKDRYYEPGLLAKKLGFNPDPLRSVATFTAPALYPEVTLNQPSVTDPVLRIALTNRGGGIGRVMVTVNGKEMTADARPRGADPTAASLNVELPLTAYQRWLKDGKKNSIEVRVYNAEGYLASRAAVVDYDAPGESTRPEMTLRAVIVGVSDYAGDQLDLRYAAKDAEDMAKAVELGGRRLFGADHVQIRILTTTRTDQLARPTKANIKAAFESLGEAKPDDILFVYFSGHGVAFQDVYHYPTQEAHTTNLDDPAVRAERSVSSDEIAQWLKQSPATQRQVLVLDTCAAGAAAKSLVEHRNVPSDQIRALERLKDRTGVHVLMGSAADRVSWEATQFEQGLLTHALLRGMKGAALRDDAYIDVSRLFNYVADEVPKLAVQVGGIQRPHLATPRGTNVESFDIGQLTNADRNAIPLRNPKPLLLRPTLLNGQSAFDDLSLEPKLRTRLREESFARTRGRESAVVFVEADELPGAIKPSGLYSINGSRLRAKMILRRDTTTKEIQVEGTKNDVDGFIEKTVQAVTRAVDAWK